jgi:site-specific DNA-methyltransferase (adenine-specific)
MTEDEVQSVVEKYPIGPPGFPEWTSEDGRVRLILGDCLEVLPTLGGIDAVVTDPPYGHNNNNNSDLIHRREAALGRGEHGEARAIANDGPEANEIYRNVLPELYRVLEPGCCCCCCGGGGGPDPQFARWSLWMDEVFRFKQMVVWDKGPMGMGWHYRRSYETVLVGEKPGAACRWHGGNRIENIIRPGAYGIRKIIPQEDEHPCAKPIELYQAFIEWHTEAGDIVLDPFAGEGPCAIACIRTGRRFVGIEIEPKYFEIAVKRCKKAIREDKSSFQIRPKPRVEQTGFFERKKK